MLGNIKFIGELGKLQMLHEGILHKCIKQLLEKKRNTPIRDMAEDLECLCQIMRTVGPRLDSPKAKAWMDQYFERVRLFSQNLELPSRIRFMLQDVIELREKKRWVPRRVALDNGPKTITQIRQEAVDELGVFIPPPSAQNRGQALMGGRAMNGTMGAGASSWKQGGMGDLFSMPPPGTMGNFNSIGTGPGVIQVDNFASSYQNSMGRSRNNQQNQGFNNNFMNRRPDSGGNSPRNQRHNQQNQQQQQQQQGNPGNNQQSQYYNKQQQQQGQNQQATGNRDLPPRFQRMSINHSPPSTSPISGSNKMSREEVSLRPVKNFTVLKPNTPGMLPKSAQGPSSIGGFSSLNSGNNKSGSTALNPLLSKQPLITIKQNSEDKGKSKKKECISKEELQKTVTSLLSDYLGNNNKADVATQIKDMSIPKKLIRDLLSQLLVESVDKSETERDRVMDLISELKKDGFITTEQFMDSLRRVMDKMSNLEEEVPLVKSSVARFAASSLVENIASLEELAEPLENGVHHPLFLLCLQQVVKLRSEDWLVGVFSESKINLQGMLPEIDQKKERMLEILEDRNLSFLFPLLKIQSELWKQIQAEPTATAIFKWIKDKVDNDMQNNPGFIDVLTTSILRFVTGETTLGKAIDPTAVPDKTLIEKEKDLLLKLKAVLQMFLHERLELQVSALYATQVFCHNHQFPKGMLLRFFVYYYDMEILDEESFLRWKEEVNDKYPGKGKALFQVNQWLTWLEQAEEESEEEEDDQ
ncbi:eukaryotic translation initiation factor 4 gamma 2-like isoform X2 [Haliotis asinina]